MLRACGPTGHTRDKRARRTRGPKRRSAAPPGVTPPSNRKCRVVENAKCLYQAVSGGGRLYQGVYQADTGDVSVSALYQANMELINLYQG